MFGIDVFEPQTMWLNITNIGLGIVTFVCIAAVAWGAAVEILERIAAKSRAAVERDDHAFAVPGLGLTMADGGEKHDEPETK
ncbi:MAG: hypothetical protein HYU52_14795 [Acidobacteria bacterium]|nr:hypothetical protein [Acidobacteriota bacterium]